MNWTLIICLAEGEPSAKRGDLVNNKNNRDAEVKNNSNKNLPRQGFLGFNSNSSSNFISLGLLSYVQSALQSCE